MPMYMLNVHGESARIPNSTSDLHTVQLCTAVSWYGHDTEIVRILIRYIFKKDLLGWRLHLNANLDQLTVLERTHMLSSSQNTSNN